VIEPGWDWCPVKEFELVLGEWDRAAVTSARDKAREMLRDTDTALRLLPDAFRLSELRGVYEAHWSTEIDASNFAKRALAADRFLKKLEPDRGKPGRPARLYRRGPGTAPRLAPA
jgi:8-oxo-dGTP diphosphatase